MTSFAPIIGLQRTSACGLAAEAGSLAPSILGALFLCSLSLAPVAFADGLSSLLRKPVSPASIALLAPYSKDPQVVARWRAALADSNPDVRGVAARAVTTCGVSALIPDVESALAKETAVTAAREEIRAIILVGPGNKDSFVLEAASRFGGAIDADLVLALARARGLAALPMYFDKLDKLHLLDGDRAAFFRIATRGQDSLLGAASMALGRNDLTSWRAILSDARHDPALASSPVVRTALGSEAPALRSETAWYLAREYCDQPPPDGSQLLAILKNAETSTHDASADPEVAFGQELLRRVLGQPAVENKDWIACLRTNEHCHLDSDLDLSPLRRYLTEGERSAIDERNVKNAPPELQSSLLEHMKEPSKPHASTEPAFLTQPKMWMAQDLPHGLGIDLRKVASCDVAGLAKVGYRPDGRPATITMLVGDPIKVACFDAFKSLYLLSLAPANEPTTIDDPLTIETSLQSGFFSCDEESRPITSRGETVRIRGGIKPPTISGRVEPDYPIGARQAHLEGITIIEAVISRVGCVKDLHIIKSSALALDAAAMNAISQWTYRPAELNGNPVAVYLTVTVNFRLHR